MRSPVFLPIHEDKWAEAVTENFAWPVNPAEIAFQEAASVRQLSLIPEYRGYTGLGMVAWQSPNCSK